MRLLRIPEPFDHLDVIFEPGLDGFRASAGRLPLISALLEVIGARPPDEPMARGGAMDCDVGPAIAVGVDAHGNVSVHTPGVPFANGEAAARLQDVPAA